jgi:hypothetical protein
VDPAAKLNKKTRITLTHIDIPFFKARTSIDAFTFFGASEVGLWDQYSTNAILRRPHSVEAAL